ncbi:hypothetical protein ACH5RR_016425 [Cinchona calisaya]|uniref:non-specific serine/threonine protein kinase n=1 Tax=Cinchona calisaya TaxID=153742 RepID=A0ABD2ZVU2_9GENT
MALDDSSFPPCALKCNHSKENHHQKTSSVSVFNSLAHTKNKRICNLVQLYLYIILQLCHHHFVAFADADIIIINTPIGGGDVAINCGSFSSNSNGLDGREWIGETKASVLFLSGSSKSRPSTVLLAKSFSPADPVPYKTSRISAAPFQYTFQVSPGQKFIRLHFYPASYRGFEKSVDFFTVKSGPFTLLRDFSASVSAESLGVKYLVKEFCVNVEENMKLNISFLPSAITKSNINVYAFVNGIEIVSMPTALYYTPDGDLGACVVGVNNGFYVLDNSTALEVMERLNVGGRSISSGEDFGMFRSWSEDPSYLLESRVERVNHPVLKIRYKSAPAFIAPPKIYQTSWKKGGNSIRVDEMNNLTWKIPVEVGFGYLVRLHFCEIDDVGVESQEKEFRILMNNQIAETQANVIRWSGGNGIPVYKDYMVKMKGDKEGGLCDLLITLQSVNELVFGFLNGIEIFKLSNLENSLASPNPTSPERVSTSWNLRIQKVFLAFGQSNVVVTGMTVLIISVNIIVYNLRQIWEEKFNLENDKEAAITEPSFHHFSLAEIISATQNFSDAFVIGRGGFGKVYKGFIHSILGHVAIKRLSLYSRQGAREFWTEIETLSKLRHVHLVSLLGYCNESQEMILVYEYMPCGTVADNLYKLSRKGKDIVPLTWEQRLKICIGAARGLEYLHTGIEYGVIHRDVKDSNILLDENFVAKISDFGLSKLDKVTQSKSYVSTKVKGTVGYLDPDYLMTHRLTRKSDVYAFGVVLLVVLAGRPALDTRTPEEPQSLLSCFRECIAEGDMNRLIDASLQGKISLDSLREFMKSVENCLHYLPKKRPTMAQVVASLEQALLLQDGPMISASGDATINSKPFEEGTRESLQVLEESFPPKEEITSKSSQDPASLTRGQDYAPVRKSVWVLLWRAIWNRGNQQQAEVSLLESKLPLFSYKTLANATDNFKSKNMISQGVFGPVYKGILFNGQEIAVKWLSNSSTGMTQFMNKVEVTSKLQHRNIVTPLGCCAERGLKMLIYEYMPNKSLDVYLVEKRDVLDWSRRAIIIQGIARGLLYLHRDSRLKIIHRDLKLSNILLDRELHPKISDFGLARILEANRTMDATCGIVGTCGYMAPEYPMEKKFSEKTDVFRYGVLVLEIVSGKRNSGFWQEGNRIGYAWKLWKDNETMKLVDPSCFSAPFETEMQRYVHVGLLCVQASSNDRPDMSTVILMLSGEIAELPQPKLPVYYERVDLSETEFSQ